MLPRIAVAGQNLGFREQPVLSLVAGFVSPLFPEFVSTAANFFIQIDGEYVLAYFRLCFLQFVDFGLDFGSCGNEGRLSGAAVLRCAWVFALAMIRYSLQSPKWKNLI
jgi:hypothetical protein